MINNIFRIISKFYRFKKSKIFTETEADFFIHGSEYQIWANKQPLEIQNIVLRICGRSLDEKTHFQYATETYNTIDSIIYDCPTIEKDIIVFRAGKIGQKSRRYVSTSLLLEVSKNYNRFVKRILLPQGTVFYPSAAFMPKTAIDAELEIVIDNRYIKKHFWGYEYFKYK